MTRLDEIRSANPELGFGLYALAPGGDITLEIYAPDGQVFTWTGPTEAHVLDLAFSIEAASAEAQPINIFD